MNYTYYAVLLLSFIIFFISMLKNSNSYYLSQNLLPLSIIEFAYSLTYIFKKDYIGFSLFLSLTFLFLIRGLYLLKENKKIYLKSLISTLGSFIIVLIFTVALRKNSISPLIPGIILGLLNKFYIDKIIKEYK